MSTEKIRLKEMSHKKLRKLCKGLGKECAEYSKQVGLYKSAEIRNAGTIGELKSYAKSLEKTLASEARRIQEKNKKIEEKNKRIEELEQHLDRYLMSIGKIKQPFIGELPEDVGMGIDGQLRPYREMSDAEHQAWVAREVARAMQENYDNVHEEQIEGNCIGHTKSAEVDEAVEIADVGWAVDWAKRNGHHQPEGNPEPNKMDTVKIKSADEISAENTEKHTEMVCKDIQQDVSRILNVDPMFDEKGKSHQSLD